MDMDDPKTRLKAMDLLIPFEALAKQVGLENKDESNELWGSLRQAEKGDASDLKAQIREWIVSMEEQPEEASP